jgi:mannose-6-phosphate isomerase-like protein (cupin superfamily)
MSFVMPRGMRTVSEIHDEPESGARISFHSFRHDGEEWVASYERILPPHTGRGIALRHLAFDEGFTVVSGRAVYRLDGKEGTLEAGEELIIPAGVPHLDPYNPFDEPMEFVTAARPMRQPILIYARTFGMALRRGTLTEQQQFGFLQLVTVAHTCGMDTYLPIIPLWLQRFFAVPLIAGIGRLRGYRPAPW